MGNHDVEIENVRRPGFRFYDPEWQNRGYQAGLAHAAKSLDMEQAGWLARLPYTMTIPGAVVAHGSWNDPENFNYIEDAESAAPTLAALRQSEFKVGFFGHTHLPSLRCHPPPPPAPRPPLARQLPCCETGTGCGNFATAGRFWACRGRRGGVKPRPLCQRNQWCSLFATAGV